MKRDRRDPFGVDLAMEKGLPEPIPALPPADEPLWIKKNVGGVGGGPRTANDENKLVAKKFKVRPSTQAEGRDCAAEVGLDYDAVFACAGHGAPGGRCNCNGAFSFQKDGTILSEIYPQAGGPRK